MLAALLRVDEANRILGVRLNVFTSVLVFLGALIYFLMVKGPREYVVPIDAWHAAGNTEPPMVMGMHMHPGPNPALRWYIFHIWVWRHNPAGIFEDWNPAVACD